MVTYHKLSAAARNARIIRLHAEGKATPIQLAKAFDVSEDSVWKLLRLNRVEIPGGMLPKQKSKTVRYWTCQDPKHEHISEKTALACVRKHLLKTTPPPRAKRSKPSR